MATKKGRATSGKQVDLSRKGGDKPAPERILEASSRLFSINGFKGTSVNEIAKRAKVNKATVFYYYGSKANLLFTLASRNLETRIQEASAIVDSDLIPEKKLEALMSCHLKGILKTAKLSQVARVERKSLTPKMLSAYVQLRDKYEALFCNAVDGLHGDGMTGDSDSKYHAKFILGILNSIPDWYRSSGPLSMEEVVAKAADVVKKGLARS